MAQPGSASGLGPEGRGFESRRPDSLTIISTLRARSSAGLEQRTSNPQAVGSSPTGRTQSHLYNGDVAEWLGKGLQNLVRRFESARHLQSNSSTRLI